MRGLLTGAGVLSLATLAVAQDRLDLPGYTNWRLVGDHYEILFDDGLALRRGGLELVARRGVLRVDGTAMRAQVEALLSREGLPRRGAELPPARTDLTEAVLRARLQSLLRAGGGRTSLPHDAADLDTLLSLTRSLYLEGEVTIVQDGLEVVRCKSLWVSTHDDRAVFRDVLLRLRSLDARGAERIFVVRAPELVRQGVRTVGRNVSVTGCNAGNPHYEMRSGELQLVERGSEFEIDLKDLGLAFGGRGLVPLPNVRFFTGDQSPIPLQGASAGYSDREGVKLQLDFGGSMNRTGGAIHEFLTGRAPETFRGDWHLGAGWIEKRGFPLDASWTYRGDGLYRGRTDLFWLDDSGEDIREIQTHLDGTGIDQRTRTLVRTENRFWLREDTTVDLQVFDASDPAVYPEFHSRDFHEEELPETSAHLRWARSNRIATLTGRTNLDSFSYEGDRTLADSFVREEPYLTFDWIGEPLLELPADGALVLGTSTGIGRFVRRNDPHTPVPAFDEPVTRVDQSVELAAPMRLGAFALRPYLLGNATWYDETLRTDADEARGALGAGVSLATRLQRTWAWTDDAGAGHALRHVVSPVLRYDDVFEVTEDPTAYPQFDPLDALTERRAVRVEVLQRLQKMQREPEVRAFDAVWLDLAQTVFPSEDRDNAGHGLGLLEYELIVRPQFRWLPVPNLALLCEGEHDWDDGMRTFNTGVRFGKVLGLDWFTEYRTDFSADGTIAYGAGTNVAGRWDLLGSAQYDLERDENLNYSVFLARLDHDWRIRVGVTFDVVTDDTSFFVMFEPSFGGLFRPRDTGYIAGNRAYGTGDFIDY